LIFLESHDQQGAPRPPARSQMPTPPYPPDPRDPYRSDPYGRDPRGRDPRAPDPRYDARYDDPHLREPYPPDARIGDPYLRDAGQPVVVRRKKAMALGIGLIALTGMALGLFITLDRRVRVNPIDDTYRGQLRIEQTAAAKAAAAQAAAVPVAPEPSPGLYPSQYATSPVVPVGAARPVPAPTPAGTAPAVAPAAATVAPAAAAPAAAPRQAAPAATRPRVIRTAPGETVVLPPRIPDADRQRADDDDAIYADDEPPPEPRRRRRARDRDRDVVLDENGDPAPGVIILDEPRN
jgi:hypothetical protein